MSGHTASQAEASGASVSVASERPHHRSYSKPRVECLFPGLEPVSRPSPAPSERGLKPRRADAVLRRSASSVLSAETTYFDPYAEIADSRVSAAAPKDLPVRKTPSKVTAVAPAPARTAEAAQPGLPRQVVATHETLPYPASVISSAQSSWRAEFAKAEPGIAFQRGIIGQDMNFTKPTSMGVNYFRMPDYPDRAMLVSKENPGARQSQRNVDWLEGLIKEAERGKVDGSFARRVTAASMRPRSDVTLAPETEHRSNYRSYAKFTKFLKEVAHLGQGEDPYHRES
mmetsp:Transcript_31162/g.72615  ORF Transcript_31162/g.72615 Transcript_31162/m.72615 type:complete len:285 (-) Transcript_31162:81-935(-)